MAQSGVDQYHGDFLTYLLMNTQDLWYTAVLVTAGQTELGSGHVRAIRKWGRNITMIAEPGNTVILQVDQEVGDGNGDKPGGGDVFTSTFQANADWGTAEGVRVYYDLHDGGDPNQTDQNPDPSTETKYFTVDFDAAEGDPAPYIMDTNYSIKITSITFTLGN